MPRTKTIPRSNVGDKVRVCSGVSDPDYDDLTIGRWAGTIAEVQDGTPRTLLVRWSSRRSRSKVPSTESVANVTVLTATKCGW